MRGIFRTGGRRAVALVQLMLFAFSASTSLLPCGETNTGRDDHRPLPAHTSPSVDHAVHQDGTNTSASHMHGHAAHAASEADLASLPTPPVDHQRSHDSTCPWVVGCVGMAQFSLDDELRIAEQPRPSATPAGHIMRRVITHRDIESPPPRI